MNCAKLVKLMTHYYLLKYLFPIEEREFKSTSRIKSENKNIIKLSNEIKNSNQINETA